MGASTPLATHRRDESWALARKYRSDDVPQIEDKQQPALRAANTPSPAGDRAEYERGGGRHRQVQPARRPLERQRLDERDDAGVQRREVDDRPRDVGEPEVAPPLPRRH